MVFKFAQDGACKSASEQWFGTQTQKKVARPLENFRNLVAVNGSLFLEKAPRIEITSALPNFLKFSALTAEAGLGELPTPNDTERYVMGWIQKICSTKKLESNLLAHWHSASLTFFGKAKLKSNRTKDTLTMARSSTRNAATKLAPSLPGEDMGEAGSPSSVPKVLPKKKQQTTKSPVPEKNVAQKVTPVKEKHEGGAENTEKACTKEGSNHVPEETSKGSKVPKDNTAQPGEENTNEEGARGDDTLLGKRGDMDDGAPPVTPDQPIKNPYTAASHKSPQKKSRKSPKALKFLSTKEEKENAAQSDVRSIYDFDMGAKKPNHDGTVRFQLLQGVRSELYLLALITPNNPGSTQFHGEKVRSAYIRRTLFRLHLPIQLTKIIFLFHVSENEG